MGLILLWALAVIAVVFVEAAWFGNPAVERGNFASIENHLVQKLLDAAENKRLGSAGLLGNRKNDLRSEAAGFLRPDERAWTRGSDFRRGGNRIVEIISVKASPNAGISCSARHIENFSGIISETKN